MEQIGEWSEIIKSTKLSLTLEKHETQGISSEKLTFSLGNSSLSYKNAFDGNLISK